nr:MAG TPA: hypothetical protein [Caudoviricetes sp.]
MNNFCKTKQVSYYRNYARKNDNVCVCFPQKSGVLFKVAFYQNANFLKVSLENSFKKPLVIENLDVLTDETIRVIINSYFKRALKAD